MSVIQRVLLIGLGVLVLSSTIELIRQRRLREEYSLLWLLTGIVLLMFTVFPESLYLISSLLGFYHLTTMLFTTFLFLLLIVLHYSTVISQLSERETELAQQVALLTWQVEQLSAQQVVGQQTPHESSNDQASLN